MDELTIQELLRRVAEHTPVEGAVQLLLAAADEIERLTAALDQSEPCACEWELDANGKPTDKIKSLCGAHEEHMAAQRSPHSHRDSNG